MVDAEPFAALRYDPAVAGRPATTSAPAYDDVGRFDYAHHRAASPYTVLELFAGDGAEAYRTAGAAFQRWRRTGVLVEESAPAFYLYEIHELRAGVPHVLRGVLAAVAVADGNLEPHEAVDEQRVRDRVRRLDVVPADLAPVFAVHTAAPPALRAALDAAPTSRPVIAFTDEFGADHRVWSVRDAGAIAAIRDGLRTVRAVIADGHHRYAAARARAAAGGPSTRTLAYLVDGSTHGPQLQAVHRLVRPLTAAAASAIERDFTSTSTPSTELDIRLAATAGHAFGLRLSSGKTFLLTPKDPQLLADRMPADRSAAWRALDAAVWDAIVRPALGAAEVAYHSDIAAAVEALEAAPGSGLFLLRPPTLAQVFDCAVNGDEMPAKTTWFRPKPRAGLIMRSLH